MCCMEGSTSTVRWQSWLKLLDKAAQRPNRGSRARDARACAKPAKEAGSSRALPPWGVGGRAHADACDMSNV